jgi:hypothetical protein
MGLNLAARRGRRPLGAPGVIFFAQTEAVPSISIRT